MLIANTRKTPTSMEKSDKKSIFSYYTKNINYFRYKPIKKNINRPKNSNTLVIYNSNNLNLRNITQKSNNTNSTVNSLKEMDIITSSNKHPKKLSNFYLKKKNKKLQIYSDDSFNNKKSIINIINYSKISSLYNSQTHPNNSRYCISKPEFKIKIKGKNEFNSLEKYMLKVDKNIKEIKREYKPNLTEFYINKELKNYINKSKTMMHVKDDLNILYRDSYMLNNICDIVGNALFKLRIKKRNNIKKIKNELNKIKSENKYKKFLDLKIKNKEIPDVKLFRKKKFVSTDNIEFNPRLKPKIIYQNGYHSNSIKTSFNRYYYKKELNNILLNNKTYVV